MTPVKIPMIDSPNFSVDVVLDQVQYTLSFVWNSRAEFWSMSLSLVDGTILVSGIRLVCFFPLLKGYQYNPNVPQGLMVVIDQNKATGTQEPGRYDFVRDRNLELCYVEQ
jgi:hypothetical protein